MQSKRITYLMILALFLTEACQNTADKQAESKPPNIVYVLADDLGYGDLQAFNPEGKISTPQLDQLAAEGMMFTDAHTSSSVCTPTRYGILTGRYNWRTHLKQGVLWGKSPALIDLDRETVPSLLKKAGYHTAFIGKWHLGWGWEMDSLENIDFNKPISHSPNDLGFDYAYGHAASLDMPPYVYVENEMTTAIPTETTVNEDYQGFWREGLTAPDFVHEEVTPNFFDRSIRYIQERSAQDEPFFLYLALPSPHTPILPTGEWVGKSGLNPYGDFVMMVDDYMGQLNRAIKEAAIEENTLVIFTSDNGCSPRALFEELEAKGHDPSYHFRGHKADIYEGGHRVPFIAKWPASIKSGSSDSSTICTTDLMATCADLTSQSLAETAGVDSYSLMPLFKDKSEEYQRESTVHHSIDGEFAIRQDQWKLIMCAGSGGWSWPRKNDAAIDTLPDYQLYNLAEDIAEQGNLIDTNPQKAADLQQLLEQIIHNGRSTEGPAQSNDQVAEWPQIHWMASEK